jgi:succinoglycan biosynthesis protein ExoA
VAGDSGPTARGIARALCNPWVLGGASYRRPGASGPVDTVYLGAFRTEDLRRAGGWDPGLLANEDYELCARFRDSGSLVWLEEDVVVAYEARTGLVALAQQYHAFGTAKVEYWRLRRGKPAARQVLAVAGAALALAAAPWAARRPIRLVSICITGAAALAVVDHVADPVEPDPAVRCASVLASALLVASWLSGIATATARVLRRRRRA